MHITGLYTYPIKSCGRLAHERLSIGLRGPQYDRHWIVTDAEGLFLTQREHPQMARIQPRFDGDQLVVSAPGVEPLALPLADDPNAPRGAVTVWRDTVRATDAGPHAAAWFSTVMGVPVRLFALNTASERAVDAAYAPAPAQVGFADGYPLLLISEGSLVDLNARLTERGKSAVPMARFRPNIVVSDGGPFVEDGWSAFSAGDVTFDVVKPCARCKITTVDPATGSIPEAKEPLATLATFRNSERGVLFGQNIIHRGRGAVAVGDAVTVL